MSSSFASLPPAFSQSRKTKKLDMVVVQTILHYPPSLARFVVVSHFPRAKIYKEISFYTCTWWSYLCMAVITFIVPDTVCMCDYVQWKCYWNCYCWARCSSCVVSWLQCWNESLPLWLLFIGPNSILWYEKLYFSGYQSGFQKVTGTHHMYRYVLWRWTTTSPRRRLTRMRLAFLLQDML